EAYTDGSAPVRNPGGPAGFSAILVGYTDLIGPGKPLPINPSARLDLGGYVLARAAEPLPSNNRAEIAGVLAALVAVRTLGQTPPRVQPSIRSRPLTCATGPRRAPRGWRCLARRPSPGRSRQQDPHPPLPRPRNPHLLRSPSLKRQHDQ